MSQSLLTDNFGHALIPLFLLVSIPPQNVLGSWYEIYTKQSPQVASYIMDSRKLMKKRGNHLSVGRSVIQSVCLSSCWSVCLSVRLFICLSVHPSICLLLGQSFSLSVCPAVGLSVSLSVYSSVCLSIRPSVYCSVSHSVCLFIQLFFCLSMYISTHLSIHLSIHLLLYLTTTYVSFYLAIYLSVYCRLVAYKLLDGLSHLFLPMQLPERGYLTFLVPCPGQTNRTHLAPPLNLPTRSPPMRSSCTVRNEMRLRVPLRNPGTTTSGQWMSLKATRLWPWQYLVWRLVSVVFCTE